MHVHRTPWKAFLSALGAACLLCLASPAPASTARHLDLTALVAASDLVVRGVMIQSSARRTPEGRIVTDSVFRVDEALSGEAGGDTLVVTTLGGAVDGEGQRVSGSPVLQVGDEVVLFLRRPGPVSSVARTFVVGMAQGAFHVRRVSGRPFLERHLDGLDLTGSDAEPMPEDLDGLRRTMRQIEQALPRTEGLR